MSGSRLVYWIQTMKDRDDFGRPYRHVMYDAKTRHGPWACMSKTSWDIERASPQLGPGHGQKYERQPNGRWLKTEG